MMNRESRAGSTNGRNLAQDAPAVKRPLVSLLSSGWNRIDISAAETTGKRRCNNAAHSR